MTSFLSNFLLCFQEKINSKKLCKNKSFTLMKNLCNLVSWEPNSSAQPHCCSCHQQHVPSCYPLETVSSVGWSNNFSLLHLIWKGCQWCCSGLTVETAGRWTQTSFPIMGFARFITYQFCERGIVLGCEALPCQTCSCLSNEAKSVDNPGLANWMFCNGDSWIITISRSKSVTRRCSWLLAFLSDCITTGRLELQNSD